MDEALSHYADQPHIQKLACRALACRALACRAYEHLARAIRINFIGILSRTRRLESLATHLEIAATGYFLNVTCCTWQRAVAIRTPYIVQ